MRRFAKPLLITACAVLLLAAAAVLVLRTNWFQQRLRESIVASLERATGGRVEIGSFSYNWSGLSAELKNVVIHGTEPLSEPPLFQAQSIRIGLEVRSLLKREADLARLVIDTPKIDVRIHPDGTTNIPAATYKTGRFGELLNLRIEHFEVNRGTVEIAAHHTAINASSENTQLLLAYRPEQSGYSLRFHSPQVQFASDRFAHIAGSAVLDAVLQRNRLSVEQLSLSSGASTVHAEGVLSGFSKPDLELKLSARVSASQLARVANRPELQGGEIGLEGKLRYDPSARIVFSGALNGRNLNIRSGRIALKNTSVDSEVLASEDHAQFNHLVLTALGSKFTGQATLHNLDELQMDGSIAGLNVPHAVALVDRTPLPWACRAAGRVKVAGMLSQRNWRMQAALQLTPIAGPTPISGAVDFSYDQRGNRIEFQPSAIHLPSTAISFSGELNEMLALTLDTRDLADLGPVLPRLPKTVPLPAFSSGGSLQFNGTISSPLRAPRIQGQLAIAHAKMNGQPIDQFRSIVDFSAEEAKFTSLSLDSDGLHASGNAQLALANWALRQDGPIRLQGQLRGLNISRFAPAQATASATVNMAGSFVNPRGSAEVRIQNAAAYGERLNAVRMNLAFAGRNIQIAQGRIEAGPARILFSGNYTRDPQSWRSGELTGRLDSNGFPLASLTSLRRFEPGLNARFEVHGEASLHIAPGSIQPGPANGTLAFHRITVDGLPYGDLTANATTHGHVLHTNFSGDLRESRVNGNALVQISGENLARGEIHVSRISLATLLRLWPYTSKKTLPFDGNLEAALTFEGPIQDPARMQAIVQVDRFEAVSDLSLHNTGPIIFQLAKGSAAIQHLELAGRDTNLKLTGSFGYLGRKPLDVHLGGAVDLRILHLLDPTAEVSGRSIIGASIGGTLRAPAITGTLQIRNAGFQPKSLDTGLSNVNGTIVFNQDRATIQTLTAQSGGGTLGFEGFVNLVDGHLIYHLTTNAENVRVRYASSASVTASAQLHLTGTAENSLLSGAASISRVVLNPNTDIGNLLAALPSAPAGPINGKGFLSGLQLDVHLESAPNLQLTSALSRDIQADIDLRLRGRASSPVLLGSVSANQGDIRVFGTKYSINRCEVDFSNPAKIEPVLDLDLQTQTRGIAVDITIAGTPGKLNVNYRSDPPLQPRDIISLLTVGRTPGAASSATASNVLTTQLTNPGSNAEPGVTSVLGQAISPSSNRLSKLFGVTNIRIDPLVQGITNAAQARLTLEQQISREITVTYVTNLSETAEQIFRVEWAFSSQYSLVALRDDNGEFGIDIQYRKQFK
ncbi:MAG TPA: translocation/assembly module TamB domain-containing protein [Bryobacteraceae bacterium]|nr:translocation/assembly module TamB domain-containing protein [Bryobacteraceae bacterium]